MALKKGLKRKGVLAKGYRFAKGGRIVKAKARPAAKRKRRK